MKNYEIIEAARIEAGISESTIIDTYQGWKSNGFQVIRGEKAAMKCKIWIPKKKRMFEEEKNLTDGEIIPHGYFLKTAAYFTADQVKKIGSN